jgi:hypothetical protein
MALIMLVSIKMHPRLLYVNPGCKPLPVSQDQKEIAASVYRRKIFLPGSTDRAYPIGRQILERCSCRDVPV